MELKKIGVVGGGIMGAGIIQVISNGGFEVGFKELNQDLVEGTMARVNRIFNSAKDKGRISEKELREKIALVKGFTDDSFLDEVDLVIEAVPERIDLKKEIFKHLDKVCKPGTVLASNTSSLSISQLGGTTKKPTRVIGMHWFNPPHIMKLIEIVPGLETSQDNILALFDFCKALKKVLVKVKECAGFLVNRLLGAYVNEAIYLVMEGWPPQEIDDAAKSMGVPMGPIMLGDMVGWDTIYHANNTLLAEYGSRFNLPSLLTEIFQTGRFGAKAGKGFYKYERGRVVPDKSEAGQPPENLSSRLFGAMINEGVRCLDEKVASSGDIDTAMKMGASMPMGPLQWADEMGLDTLLHQLTELNEMHGERFLPSPLLKRKVAAGHLGRDAGKGFYQY